MRGIKKQIHKHHDLDYFTKVFDYRRFHEHEQISDRFLNSYGAYNAYLGELKASEEEPILSKTSVQTFYIGGTRYQNVYNHVFYYKEFEYDVVKARALYTEEEIKLLIFDDYDKERRRFERLKNKFDTTKDEKEELKRPRILEEIRIKVWQRDNGKCARCESREKLEYDHIVPISKGGSNTLRNIELLCEECNRSKGSTIS